MVVRRGHLAGAVAPKKRAVGKATRQGGRGRSARTSLALPFPPCRCITVKQQKSKGKRRCFLSQCTRQAEKGKSLHVVHVFRCFHSIAVGIKELKHVVFSRKSGTWQVLNTVSSPILLPKLTAQRLILITENPGIILP